MTTSNRLAALEYEPETSFCENVTTFATHRIPVLEAIDPSGLVWDKVESMRVEQYMHGGSQHVRMSKGGSFRTKIDIAGHGATTAGSPTLDQIETFKGYVFGNVGLSASASTTLTGGTATAPTTTASGTFAAGGLCFIGELGDGDGDGQMYPISTHATTTLNLLAALNGAPVNGAVLYPAAQFYFHEAPSTIAGCTTSVPGLRFRFLNADVQYQCHGCFPTAVSITGLNPNERPQMEVTWEVSYWTSGAALGTYPSAVTSNQYNPAQIQSGSLFMNAVGTATRVLRTFRELSLDIQLGMVKLAGPGGVFADQRWIGCRRVPSSISVSWVEDASAAVEAFGSGTTSYHLCYTASTTPGSRFGFYMPKVCFKTVPVQFTHDGINRMRLVGQAYTGGTTTNDLTLSAFRMGYG